MKTRTLVALFTALLAISPALAQERKMMMMSPEGERLMLPGLVLYVADDEASGEVKLGAVINFAKQGGAPPTAYSDLELEEGDVLMMVDAQPVPSAKDFIKHYQAAQVGAEISLGLRAQSGEVKVVSFKKPDPAELPKMQTFDTSDLTPEQLEELKKKGKLMIKKPQQKPEEKTPPPGDRR